MNWIILAVLGGFFSNVYNFSNRYVLKDQGDPLAFGWFLEASRLLIFLLIAIINASFASIFSLPIHSLLLLLALGFVEVLSIYAIVHMHAYTHLSISTIIARTRVLWIPLLAFFFLQESLKFSEYIGIVILFLGLGIAVAPKKIFVDKGIAFSYLSAFVSAIIAILQKLLADGIPISTIMVFMSLPSAIVLPIFMKDSSHRLTRIFKDRLWIKFAASLANVLAMYFYIFALTVGPVSKVSGIYQAMLIASVFAGIIFLNEREDLKKKIVGSIIVIAGVVLLTVY